MFQLQRSTVLADVRSQRSQRFTASAVRAPPLGVAPIVLVRTGGLGMSARTFVGSAARDLQRAGVRTVSVAVGADPYAKPDTKYGTSAPTIPPLPDPVTNVPLDDDPKKKTPVGMAKTSTIRKLTTIAFLTPFVLGPPVIGYLVFGWIGAFAGVVIAAPVAAVLLWYY